jgi:hypothetical protein
MQLPRGTFREIRKIVAIENLFRDLEAEKFTGIASISSQSLTGTLVFKAGKCILVKFRNIRGDTAWDELQKEKSEEVDAALSLLGDAQIDLALEFNKQCRITRSGKHAPAPAHPQRPAPSAPHEPSRAAPVQKPAAPAAPLKPPVKPAPARYHVPAPPTAAPAAPLHSPPPYPPPVPKTPVQVPPVPPVPVLRHEETMKGEMEGAAKNGHDTSSFEADLDTFDTMDIDNVTDKIRTDCKTMIKQLHLDHLMER